MARHFCAFGVIGGPQPETGTGGFPEEARAASLCRIRAQAACTHCCAAPSAQANSPARFTSPVVYKKYGPVQCVR